MHGQAAIGYARSIIRRCKISQGYLRQPCAARPLYWHGGVAFCWGIDGIIVPRLAALSSCPIQLHGLDAHTRRVALEPAVRWAMTFGRGRPRGSSHPRTTVPRPVSRLSSQASPEGARSHREGMNQQRETRVIHPFPTWCQCSVNTSSTPQWP